MKTCTKSLKTPFRYPGSKSKRASQFVRSLEHDVILDPFVGGGSILCAALNQGKQVIINDKDPSVSAFWKAVFDDEERSSLLLQIDCTPTVEQFREVKASPPSAFRAIFLNRCAYSGIMSSGPLGGYGQNSQYSVGCRYNKEVLSARITALGRHKDRVTVLPPSDWRHVLDNTFDCAIYLDPPYWHQGNSLYPTGMTKVEHQQLANYLKTEKRDWLLSYDNCTEIKELYSWADIDEDVWRYSGRTARKNEVDRQGKELIIKRKNPEPNH